MIHSLQTEEESDLKVEELVTDIKTNNFYRCISHQYPYVKAETIWKQNIKQLVLQFWGHKTFPSVAIPFKVKNQDDDDDKRIDRDLHFLKGTFKDDQDEEQSIQTGDKNYSIDFQPQGGDNQELDEGTIHEKSSEWLPQ